MRACVQRGRSHGKKPSKSIQRRYPYLLRHLQRLLFILKYITSVVLRNFSYYLPPILLPDGNFPCGARILPDSLKSKHDNYQLSRFTDRIVYLIRTKQDNFDDPSSWEWNMDDLILKAASCRDIVTEWQSSHSAELMVSGNVGPWSLNALISSVSPVVTSIQVCPIFLGSSSLICRHPFPQVLTFSTSRANTCSTHNVPLSLPHLNLGTIMDHYRKSTWCAILHMLPS